MKRLIICLLGAALGAAALAQPKEITVKAGDIVIEMVRIEPGSVTVGDSTYTVDAPFYIAKNMVKWGEWFDVCGHGTLTKPLGKVREYPVPMDYISRDKWTGKLKPDENHSKYVEPFAYWIKAHGGQILRLPTLAEWMVACGPVPAAEDLDRIAWIDGARHGVGEKEPNVNGVYDIVGGRTEMVEVPGDGFRYIGGLPLVAARKQALKNPELLYMIRKQPMDNMWAPSFRLVLHEESATAPAGIKPEAAPAQNAGQAAPAASPDATAIKIARQMLAKGIADETIAECTGLSLEVIAALK
ncbi:MAG: hypothetical protein J5632_02295 [Bacteroidales bacterium]|nr:hypothetical protein [Bacteroidales bacterium]